MLRAVALIATQISEFSSYKNDPKNKLHLKHRKTCGSSPYERMTGCARGNCPPAHQEREKVSFLLLGAPNGRVQFLHAQPRGRQNDARSWISLDRYESQQHNAQPCPRCVAVDDTAMSTARSYLPELSNKQGRVDVNSWFVSLFDAEMQHNQQTVPTSTTSFHHIT